MKKKKEPFPVSSDVVDAISKGKSVDKEFDQKVKQEYGKDIEVRKNLDKAIWNARKKGNKQQRF